MRLEMAGPQLLSSFISVALKMLLDNTREAETMNEPAAPSTFLLTTSSPEPTFRM